MNYLKTIHLKKTKVFGLFVTWGGAGKTSKDTTVKLKNILKAKGNRVTDDCFVCYGGGNFLRRGHPYLDDSKAVKIWTQKTIDTILFDFK